MRRRGRRVPGGSETRHGVLPTQATRDNPTNEHASPTIRVRQYAAILSGVRVVAGLDNDPAAIPEPAFTCRAFVAAPTCLCRRPRCAGTGAPHERLARVRRMLCVRGVAAGLARRAIRRLVAEEECRVVRARCGLSLTRFDQRRDRPGLAACVCGNTAISVAPAREKAGRAG